jgi:hypothetical protein
LSLLSLLWCQANKIWREYVVAIVIGGEEEEVIANSELRGVITSITNNVIIIVILGGDIRVFAMLNSGVIHYNPTPAMSV